MKSMKKALALILVLAMLSGMVITVSAANDDVTVALYKEDGTALGSSGSVEIGDKVTVKMFVNTSASAFSASFRIWYDPAIFTYTSGAYTSAVTAVFTSDARINAADMVNNATTEEQAKLDSGLLPVNLVLAAGSSDKTTPTGEWVSLVFTAQAAGAAQFQPQIRAFDSVAAGGNAAAGWTGSGASVTVAAPSVAVTGISLDQSSLSLTAGGETATLIATVEPDNATDKNVTWTSSDPAVATVSDGVVTPVAQGSATITAEAGGKTATCTVTVSPAGVIPVQSITILNGTEPVTEVTLGKTNSSGTLKNSVTLTAVISPENATDAQVTWTSSNASIATVTSAGKVTSKGIGTAVITASAGGVEATCTITVIQNVTSITVTPSTYTGRVGGSLQLSATVAPDNAFNRAYHWESSNTDLATVDNNGLVTFIGAGSVQISAVAEDGTNKSGKCTLTIVDGPAGGYSVELPAEQTIAAVGETVSIPIDIQFEGEENYTTFNTVDIALSYDAAALELVSTSLGTDFTDNNGKIHFLNYGADKPLGTALILQFRVKTLVESTVTVDYARIDYYENATTQDIANAAVLNGSTLIKVDVLYSVSLPIGVTSEQGETVRAGEAYTFKIGAYDPNYDYSFTVTMGGETIVPEDNGDGSYTIDSVTGDVVVGEVTRTGKEYDVTIAGEDAVGDPTANYGTDYSVTVNNQPGYAYEVTPTVNGEPVTVSGPDNEGKYTISGTDITGPIAITVEKTVVPELWHSVTFAGSGKDDVIDPVLTAAQGANYSFRLNKEEGYNYKVKYVVGTAAETALEPNDDGSYTIPGNLITDDILITVEKVKVFTVTFTGNGADHASNPALTVEEGVKYTFKIKQYEVYTYTVTVTSNGVTETLPGTAGSHSSTSTPWTYEIPNVQSDLTIDITWTVEEDRVAVFIEPFVQVDGATIYFIGVTPKVYVGTSGIMINIYDGHTLTAAKKYAETFADRLEITDAAQISNMQCYATLIRVEEGQPAPTPESVRALLRYETQSSAPEMMTPRPFAGDALTANGGVLDVNGSKLVDINDAQLVYDIYNARYGYFSDVMTIAKFLRADTNNDMCVNSNDPVVIVNTIK